MSLHSISQIAFYLHEGLVRSKRINNFMKDEIYKKFNLNTLTKEQKKEIDNVWKGINVDYRWFAWFNMFDENKESWSAYYIPSNIHYSIIDMYYTDYKRCRTIEDKNLNNLLFFDVKQPKTIVRKISNSWFDDNYNIVEPGKVKELLQINKKYILKPSIDSGGGIGIVIYNPDENTSIDDFIKNIDKCSNCIVQEFAGQYEGIASLDKNSLNTVRIITFFHNNKVYALSSIIRIGAGGSNIDNASVGGIFCGINNDGYLKNIAYNDYGDIFRVHPTTNAVFSDHCIPKYTELVALSERLHNRLVDFSKLISWDFAIDESGEPILIEVNATQGGISFHQMCNGPLFGNLTNEVIKEVFAKKSNRLLTKIF